MVDPCIAGPNGSLTLFNLAPCGPDNPPITDWCQDPANNVFVPYLGVNPCAVFLPGKPPTFVFPELPTTGATGDVGIAGIALIFCLCGAGLLRIRRKTMR